MVMVTGIICGAAVAAITTVGTEAADIIMDGTGADIADIHNKRQGRLEDEAALSTIACSSMSETSRVTSRALHGVRSLPHLPLRSGRQVLCHRVRRI
jgi:hypothetical protein